MKCWQADENLSKVWEQYHIRLRLVPCGNSQIINLLISEKGNGKMKKLVVILLLAALMLPQTVFAVEVHAPIPPAMLSGFIVEEEDDERFVLVESAVDGSQVRLYIGDHPYIVDSVSGQPMALEDRDDDKIAAYYGPAQTLSIPPQSNAVLIICNIPEGVIPPVYGFVEAVERLDGEIKVTVDSGSLIVTIGRETPLSPYLTREIVTIDAITVGDELLIWYPMVAASFPAQATANKVVRLGHSGILGDITIDSPTDISNVETIFSISEEDTFKENEIHFAPLRRVAEALGYEISWDDATKGIVLNKEEQSHTLVVGVNEYEGIELEAAPVIRNDRTYVPVRYFEAVLNAHYTFEGGNFIISGF